MNQAMLISKTGMQAQDARLQAIANNLANVKTPGFKQDRVVFEDLAYRVERMPGDKVNADTDSPLGIQLGNGTRLVGTSKVFTQGSSEITGSGLDVLIEGQGFFQVEMPNGETGYSRVGKFMPNAERRLVTQQGLPVLPEITIPDNVINTTIGANGQVTAVDDGGNTVELGQLQLANFANPAGLLALGDNLFQETVASGAAVEGEPGIGVFGKLKSGMFEGSNVQVVEEMVDMLATQRAYEMNTKVLSAADDMQKQLAQAAR
ncbi:flagellar basal-body rod protein FlgG [Chromobacterium amazonense]|uniref:flagellar basal-body rod protein FlgG n=1 Tax=Chromobacterium amazonense TaxID=1382803 RepID=UPI0031F68F5E